eukprot:5324735-Pleurochrysis_carterae.AAC.1
MGMADKRMQVKKEGAKAENGGTDVLRSEVEKDNSEKRGQEEEVKEHTGEGQGSKRRRVETSGERADEEQTDKKKGWGRE